MITLTQPCSLPEEQLTPTQQSVLMSLVTGKSISEAAHEADVHRNTVHRWLKSDETFRAAQRRMQHDARRAVEAKLHDTAMAALDCIEACLAKGDVHVAEQLLKGLGCFDGKFKDIGSEETVELARRALQQGATRQMFEAGEGARSEFGGRRSAQAEGETETAYSVPGTQYVETPEPANPNPLREQGIDAVPHHATPYDVQDPTAPDPLAPTSDFRSPTSPKQPAAPSEQVNTTELPDPYADLTAQQTMALFALETGQTISEAAATAETDRATVANWLRGDCGFQAARNRLANERRNHVYARLAQLSSRAADVIDMQVCKGNGRLAVRMLKGLGYLGGAKSSSC